MAKHPSWIGFVPNAADYLGLIPMYLDLDDPRSAKEQLNDNYYIYAGCTWNPIKGFTLNAKDATLYYPGDPPLKPVALCQFRNESVYVYEYGFVCVIQKDGSFEVARMD